MHRVGAIINQLCILVPSMDDRLEKARELLDEGLHEEALALLDEIADGALDTEDRRDRHYLSALALFELGEQDAAREQCDRARSLGDGVEIRALEAQLLLARGRPKEALRAAEQAVRLAPDDPAAHHTLGIVLTFLGRLMEADRAFARAADLDPDIYFRPHRLSRKDFDRAVEQALTSLPGPFRRHLENVEVAIEEVPSGDLLDQGTSHDLLGLYVGGTIHGEGWDFPDRILLFQRNIENASPDRRSLLREIRDTVLHEVGHHLGLDEDRLRAIEDDWEEL